MSTEAARDFISRADQDQAMRQMARDRFAEIENVGTEHGFDFTRDEFAAAMRERKATGAGPGGGGSATVRLSDTVIQCQCEKAEPDADSVQCQCEKLDSNTVQCQCVAPDADTANVQCQCLAPNADTGTVQCQCLTTDTADDAADTVTQCQCEKD